jgi:NADH-quinone oxidoreductase subunit A
VPVSPTEIVAYLALFATVGFLFLFASLLLGRFLRAHAPTVQKLETYECGEPAVGPGSVQFDLRFYVVALLFLIFEVEVAFFFPPATVFGKAVQPPARQKAALAAAPASGGDRGTVKPSADTAQQSIVPPGSSSLALASMIDLGLFFAVLLVGFAFVWRRGDLDWVRAVRHPATPAETAALIVRMRRGDF